MNKVLERHFNPETDIKKLQIFLSEMRKLVSQGGYFHLGDIIYRIYKKGNNFDIKKDIRVWEISDKIIGFVLYLTTDNNPEFQIRPDLYQTLTAKEMISWTIKRAKELKQKKIEVSCLDIDNKKRDFLLSNNFEFFDDPIVFMEIDLLKLPEYKLPNEYSFKTVDELPDLLQLTGEESNSNDYINLYSSKEFKDDLGIRVCYKGKKIVSGCICWYDNIDNSGLFEPVGTAENYRGKGLAYSAMARTLENLYRYGAKKAYVRTNADNIPAIKLYEKIGFKIINYDLGYECKINEKF